jgi:nucleoside-diphosphate-sugar epimerase
LKIFVTGGSGKLGSRVVRELIAPTEESGQPHVVSVYDQVIRHEPGVRYFSGDILDIDGLMGAMAGSEIVVHLAAIPREGAAPSHVTFRTNVLGTFNVHEAAKRIGIDRVISTSSEAALGWDYHVRPFPPHYLPVDEDHPLRAQDAYGLSKQVGEQIARAYTDSTGMATLVLRPSWILSPEEMARFHAEGGYRPERFVLCSYVDVRDAARAYRAAVERPLSGHAPLFLAADDTLAAEPLCHLLPRLLPEIGRLADGLTGTAPALSNARAKRFLGWEPRHSWRDPASL